MPTGSVKIGVEIIAYFLRYCREEVIRKRKAEREIKAQPTALEVQPRSKQFENDEMPLPQEAWDAEPQDQSAGEEADMRTRRKFARGDGIVRNH